MLSPSFDSNVPYNYNHTEWSSPERSTGPAAAGLSLTTASGVMVAVTLTSVALFVILLCFCLRRKQCWGAIPALGRIRPVDAAEPSEPVGKGLDASAVRALPSFMFWSEGCAPEGPLLCSVCIAELADGEAALRLPKCDHGFHLECIEAWLRSHSSCPLCRRPVVPGPPEVPDVIVEPVRAQFPAVASGGRISGLQEDATLVIELSSPTSPMPSPGLSSLRRLLMLGGRGVGSAHSPAEHDMEHGDAPKTPAR